MKAVVLRAIRTPLVPRIDQIPSRPGEIRVLVEACAVCRTDLHVVDGDLPDPSCRSSRPRDRYRRSSRRGDRLHSVGALVPQALGAVRKGGAGHLRRNPHERHSAISLQALVGGTAACVGCNLTRRDARDFLDVAIQAGVKTTTTVYPNGQTMRSLI